MPLSEDHALKIIKTELGATYRAGSGRAVHTGIGDDATVLGALKGRPVWTIDSCEEGVHFLAEWMTPEDVAHKSFHSALSDVPAMGGRARGALCHLTMSPRVTAGWLLRFVRAQAEIARITKTPLVGGNLSFGASLSIATTVLGELGGAGPLLRSTAQVGDEVWLVGQVGLARAGLLLLRSAPSRSRGKGAEKACLEAFRTPHALVEQGPRLLGKASSCMDISDGLARDAGQLAAASGVRVVIDSAQVLQTLSSDLEQVARRLGHSPLDLALEGGEDYALLATGPKEFRPRFVSVIGTVEKGEGAYLHADGRMKALKGGFIHGAAP